MFLNISLDKALSIVERPELVMEEAVIPGQLPSVSHSPYRPEYDWLFTYERKLARFLEPWLKEFRQELIGAKGLLSEALSNAYYHGHGKDPMLPIEVRVYVGMQGLIVRLKDTGNGFSVNQIKKQYQKGKAYFHVAGNGLRAMISSKDFGIFYDENGAAFHLLYLFNGGLPKSGENMVLEDTINNSTKDEGRNVEHKGTVADQFKSKAYFVKPPAETNWMALAILVEIKKRNIVIFGIDAEKLNPLLRCCGLLIKSADQMNNHLQIGKAGNISVRAPEGMLIINRDLSHEHILISVLKQDANIVLATNRLPEIFQYLNEQLTAAG